MRYLPLVVPPLGYLQRHYWRDRPADVVAVEAPVEWAAMVAPCSGRWSFPVAMEVVPRGANPCPISGAATTSPPAAHAPSMALMCTTVGTRSSTPLSFASPQPSGYRSALGRPRTELFAPPDAFSPSLPVP